MNAANQLIIETHRANAKWLLARCKQNAEYIGRNPPRMYCLVSTPRVGSSPLCGLLRDRGLGAPKVEWFNDIQLKLIRSEFEGPLPMHRLIELIVMGATNIDTNVFGVKLHVQHHLVCLKRYGIDLLDFLPFDAVYYIRRRDQLKQAYSCVKAQKTGIWSQSRAVALGLENQSIPITANEVLLMLKILLRYSTYFASNMKQRVKETFVYEDLFQEDCKLLEEAVNTIATDMGQPSGPLPPQKMKRQTTSFDTRQLARIKRELKEQGHLPPDY